MAMASSSGNMLSTTWIPDPIPPLLFSHLSDLTFCPDLIIPPPPPDHQPSAPLTAPLTGTAGRRLIVNAKRKRRKSRAIKSSLTTYISTDAANFRHMVQHVTGVDEGLDNIFPDNHQFDPPLVTSTSTPAVGANLIQQSRSSCGGGTSSTSVTVLPTLDTSAFLLQQEGLQLLQGKHQPVIDVDDQQQLELVAPTGRVIRERPFQMDPLINCFPTLDSWTVV